MNKMFLLLGFASCLSAQAQLEWPEARIEAHVLNEAGRAISNATVTVWFSKLKSNILWEGQEDVGVKGLSDENGVFMASHQTLARCGINVEKDGYYIGRAEVLMHEHQGDEKWLPWPKIIELKLRKVESPIPMYAKKLDETVLPANDTPIGYDLRVGDWVAPHGIGKVEDLVFTLHRMYKSRYNYEWTMTIQTSKQGDGFTPIAAVDESPQSELRLPKAAPADGYSITNFQLGLKSDNNGDISRDSLTATNFFFRVRTELDGNKQVKRAFYGKLVGPIIVDVHESKTAMLRFTCYLNPTLLDRNMEFDPKQNLFKNLSDMEQVSDP